MRIARYLCLALTVFCLYKSVVNFVAHSRVRSLPVEVVQSSLHVDIDSEQDLFFTLKLDLHAKDSSDRYMHWEQELDGAVYIEEAYDELRYWAPGTRHTIKLIRGHASEIRLLSASQPEFDAGAGWLMVVITMVFFGLATENALRRGPRKVMGPWPVFAFCGIVALGGGIVYSVTQIPKRWEWLRVEGLAVKPDAMPAVPARVEIAPRAQAVLEENKATRFLRFQWNGRPFHLAAGPIQAVLSGMSDCQQEEGACQFRVDPESHWNIEQKLEFDSDLFIPAGILFFFGFAFTGAALMVRAADH
jgi:hypothetical protein